MGHPFRKLKISCDQLFLGNLLILNKLDPLLQLAYHSLCQQLGKVFRVSIFGEWFAVISDFNHMKVKGEL